MQLTAKTGSPFQPVAVATGPRDYSLADLAVPLPLDTLVPGDGPWEVELGFGKGRYLLRRAEAEPGRRWLGVERASKYFRLFVRRVRRRGLENFLVLHGDALYLLSVVLPRGFATAVHIYFPDPWPKSRHHKRRLLHPATVDLILGLLIPGGRLYFATDFLEYGEEVGETLRGHPAVRVVERPGPWEDGARTNYEAKYMAEGRPILRLEATLTGSDAGPLFHPGGRWAVLAATEPADGELRAADEQCGGGRGCGGPLGLPFMG